MNNSKLVLTFYDKEGEVVPTLTKDPATPNDIMAALQFLEVGCEISVAHRALED